MQRLSDICVHLIFLLYYHIEIILLFSNIFRKVPLPKVFNQFLHSRFCIIHFNTFDMSECKARKSEAFTPFDLFGRFY